MVEVPAGSSAGDRGARGLPSHIGDHVFKRPFDAALAAAGLLITLPVWALVALAVWLDSGPPVFFRQPRIGRGGRMIRVLKFRSMITAPQSVEVQASRNDPRITRVGRILRRMALDELPQLWNIIAGDMSFVGPRAQPEKERVLVGGRQQDLYMRDIPGFALRQVVRPGLTGVAQLYAPRDVPHRQKFRYDLIYVRKMIAAARTRAEARRPAPARRRVGAVGRFLRADVAMWWLDCRLVARSVWLTLAGRWQV